MSIIPSPSGFAAGLAHRFVDQDILAVRIIGAIIVVSVSEGDSGGEGEFEGFAVSVFRVEILLDGIAIFLKFLPAAGETAVLELGRYDNHPEDSG